MDNGKIGLNESSECILCPRACRARRQDGQTGYCTAGAEIRVARASLHMWEEPCISGTEGSGTVFFSGCNLRCVFCQNHDISCGMAGAPITVERLAEIFFELKERGANNINLVTGGHFIPRITDALELAKGKGFELPVVYNTSGYETVAQIERMAPYVDVWLPDMKYLSSKLSAELSAAPDYFEVASAALSAMVRANEKKGDAPAEFDGRGIMTRGVIVRHLCLPGHVDDTKRVLRYLHKTYGNSIYISIMSQYTPIGTFEEHPELNRRLSKEEYERILDFAERIGIGLGFMQDGDVAEESFIPSFDLEGVFKRA